MARPVLAAALLVLCTGAATEQRTTYVTVPRASAVPVVQDEFAACRPG